MLRGIDRLLFKTTGLVYWFGSIFTVSWTSLIILTYGFNTLWYSNYGLIHFVTKLIEVNSISLIIKKKLV